MSAGGGFGAWTAAFSASASAQSFAQEVANTNSERYTLTSYCLQYVVGLETMNCNIPTLPHFDEMAKALPKMPSDFNFVKPPQIPVKDESDDCENAELVACKEDPEKMLTMCPVLCSPFIGTVPGDKNPNCNVWAMTTSSRPVSKCLTEPEYMLDQCQGSCAKYGSDLDGDTVPSCKVYAATHAKSEASDFLNKPLLSRCVTDSANMDKKCPTSCAPFAALPDKDEDFELCSSFRSMEGDLAENCMSHPELMAKCKLTCTSTAALKGENSASCRTLAHPWVYGKEPSPCLVPAALASDFQGKCPVSCAFYTAKKVPKDIDEEASCVARASPIDKSSDCFLDPDYMFSNCATSCAAFGFYKEGYGTSKTVAPTSAPDANLFTKPTDSTIQAATKAWFEFFREFGTHCKCLVCNPHHSHYMFGLHHLTIDLSPRLSSCVDVTRLHLGGKMIHQITLSDESVEKIKRDGLDVAASVEGSYSGANLKISAAYKQQKDSKNVMASVEKDVKTLVFGGFPPAADPQSPEGFSEWSKSVTGSPLPVRYELQSFDVAFPYIDKHTYEYMMNAWAYDSAPSDFDMDTGKENGKAKDRLLPGEKLREGHKKLNRDGTVSLIMQAVIFFLQLFCVSRLTFDRSQPLHHEFIIYMCVFFALTGWKPGRLS